LTLIKAETFQPELIYLTAQTIFRPIPAFDMPKINVDENVYVSSLFLRRRLFCAGLLRGHIPSAICLWDPNYLDKPNIDSESSMILRCLDEKRVHSLPDALRIIAKGIKADGEGNQNRFMSEFGRLEGTDISEYDLPWSRYIKILIETDERKALVKIREGTKWFPATVIVLLLETLLQHTKNAEMKVLAVLNLSLLSSKYSVKDVTKIYEDKGDNAMAREYREISAMYGDQESQEWLIRFLESQNEPRSWFGGKKDNRKEIEYWKQLLIDRDQEM
jgi:hypothetical protein